jgi:hypothetical protein
MRVTLRAVGKNTVRSGLSLTQPRLCPRGMHRTGGSSRERLLRYCESGVPVARKPMAGSEPHAALERASIGGFLGTRGQSPCARG